MTAPEAEDFLFETLSEYPQAHLQGDGIRSYLGILLYLHINQYSALFIDEPESFLHPPQAAAMGRAIGSSDVMANQLFISTHSKDLLNGLLDVCPERLKIVRITRYGDVNSITLLGSEDVKALSSTTLLKYTDLVNSLFHEKTVLCESDSDCMFYQAVLDSALPSVGGSVLFLPVGGKPRFKIFAELLSKLSVDYAIVADADILQEPSDFKRLLKISGKSWEDVKSDWIVLNKEASLDVKPRTVSSVKAELNEALDSYDDRTLSKDLIRDLKQIIEQPSGWKAIKRHGSRAFEGEAYRAYASIISIFNACGIFIVPVGELEKFVPDVDGHGPSWVVNVFQNYPDLSDSHYKDAKEFVESWGIG